MKKIILILLCLCLFAGCKSKDKEVIVSDQEKFAEEYSGVNKDHLFVYRSIEETIAILKNGTGVVYLGFPECQWCQAYSPILDEVAKEAGIEKIYYCNIKEDRATNSDEYQQIVELLSGRLQYDQEGRERIYVPEVVFVVDGVIVGNEHTTSKDTFGYEAAADYWAKEDTSAIVEALSAYAKQVVEALESCGACTL